MSTTKSMRNLYKGLSLYTKEEYDKIWDDSIIVLDTNILLNLFRYSDDTRKDILNCLKKFKNRIWIPYQVIKEYYKNRDKTIDDSNIVIDELKKIIDKKYSEIYEELAKQIERTQAAEEIKKAIEKSQENVSPIFQKFKNGKEQEQISERNLTIENEIFELIKDSFEDEYEYKDIENIIIEGEKRIDNNIPPGYMDGNKNEQYNKHIINGDYIIFSSIIEKAKKEKKCVIFITDDKKEDWFQKVNGKIIGGRNELLQEFYKETGKLMLMYTAEGFINKYNIKYPQKPIPAETVKEIEKVNTDVKWLNTFFGSDNEKRLYGKYIYEYNNELSINEKRKCLLEIYQNIQELINIWKRHSFDSELVLRNANEILVNVYKIDKYYIIGCSKNFAKIRSCSLRLSQIMNTNNFAYFYEIIDEILDELNHIINKNNQEIAYG